MDAISEVSSEKAKLLAKRQEIINKMDKHKHRLYSRPEMKAII